MSNPDAQARAGWPRALRRHIESLTQKPTFLTAQSQAAATASRRAFLRNISGGTPGPEERATHAFSVRKARFLRHDINRVSSLFDHEPGGLQPKPLHGLCW